MINSKPISFIALFLLAANLLAGDNTNAFRFKIVGNGYSDETVVRLHKDATLGFDAMYDAWKLFSPNPDVPSIYSKISEEQDLSINSLPEFDRDVSVTLYTNIPVTGEYTLYVEEIFDLTSNYKISLTDISSNVHYRLLGDTVLVFDLVSQQEAPTFTFNISTEAIIWTTDETCYDFKDGTLKVENPGTFDWNMEVKRNNNTVLKKEIAASGMGEMGDLASGQYVCLVESKGILDSFSFSIEPSEEVISDFILNKDTLYISDREPIEIVNASVNAQEYSWDFGDGTSSSVVNPSHIYTDAGLYEVTLIAARNNCSSLLTKEVTVLDSRSVVALKEHDEKGINILDLKDGNFMVESSTVKIAKVSVHNIRGELVATINRLGNREKFSLNDYPTGIYVITLRSLDKRIVYREKVLVK